MFIPKSRMPFITDMLDDYLDGRGHELSPEDIELVHQIRDRASLCQHGDAPFLEIEVCYANEPKSGE